ncbi:hypothetical protein RHGRI_029828 [Rhododendron griersonianum]|uniref:Uncharacterized protein n=1 Tax=Rhododendron griersonianum TaxID=479676 RepID=A0AAV6IKN9_9ERIC|nr:hypothetical protein RHGRI_029828 [Rhododendron griersonianum]
MSSPPLGKKFQCHNKVSESFAKFTRAVKKTPRRIADLLGSTRSPSHNKSFPDTTYASVNSLYECPCNYHLRQREELERRLANIGAEGKGDAMVKPESYGVVSDHDIESESENGSVGDVETPTVERRMDESGKECLSTFEVNERAERFIESFREHQKHKRQRSAHDY